MRTSFTLALILASLVFVAKTNARPDHSKSSLSTEEYNFGNGRRTRSVISLSDGLRGPVWAIIGDKAEPVIDDADDESSRPISLTPLKKEIPSGVRAPPVEHGSIQGEISSTTRKPLLTVQESKPKLSNPTKCQASILNCCRFSEPQRKNCFKKHNCLKTYETGKACLPEVIDMVIKVFTSAYSPR